MPKIRRTLSAALVTSALALSGIAVSPGAAVASHGSSSPAGSGQSSLPGDTPCEQFLAAWGPNYAFPGFDCP
jgi:hypothetical protein